MSNTDPQVVLFANNRIRPFADMLYSAYYEAKSLVADYNAGVIGSKINNAGPGEVIVDGSDLDGRTQITGGDIYNLITAAMEFVNYVEGNAVATAQRLDVLSKPHVNKL